MRHPALPLARSFAEVLARQAAKITEALSGRTAVERKADDSPVTEADRRIQRLVLDAVVENYPDHAFIGEEDIEGPERLPSTDQSEYCWVVDPLDGTRNFAHQFPIVCTSIALMRGSQPVVAVVYEHRSGWCCSAVTGEGVLCNGRPAGVSQRGVDRDTLIAVPSGRHQPVLPLIGNWTDKYVLRNVGSTALHMAYVAAGAVDAALCYECKLWDLAAGALLVTEAGGRCTDLKGQDRFPINLAHYAGRNLPFFAASPTVFDELFNDLGAHGLA